MRLLVLLVAPKWSCGRHENSVNSVEATNSGESAEKSEHGEDRSLCEWSIVHLRITVSAVEILYWSTWHELQ